MKPIPCPSVGLLALLLIAAGCGERTDPSSPTASPVGPAAEAADGDSSFDTEITFGPPPGGT